MGIMMRGVCRSCNRTSPLTDHENLWCQACAEDPQRRKLMDDRFLARIFMWFVFIALAAGFMYVKYLWIMECGWWCR